MMKSNVSLSKCNKFCKLYSVIMLKRVVSFKTTIDDYAIANSGKLVFTRSQINNCMFLFCF